MAGARGRRPLPRAQGRRGRLAGRRAQRNPARGGAPGPAHPCAEPRDHHERSRLRCEHGGQAVGAAAPLDDRLPQHPRRRRRPCCHFMSCSAPSETGSSQAGCRSTRYGNINMTAIGDSRAPRLHRPGAAGLSYASRWPSRYFIYIQEHTTRAFVPKSSTTSRAVGYGDGPGSRERLGLRGGGPALVISSACAHGFRRADAAPAPQVGASGTRRVDEVVENTGVRPGRAFRAVPHTAAPTERSSRCCATRSIAKAFCAQRRRGLTDHAGADRNKAYWISGARSRDRCARLMLADLGAEVVKIEPPGLGDDSREWPPLKNGESCYFRQLQPQQAKRRHRLDHRGRQGGIPVAWWRPPTWSSRTIGTA